MERARKRIQSDQRARNGQVLAWVGLKKRKERQEHEKKKKVKGSVVVVVAEQSLRPVPDTKNKRDVGGALVTGQDDERQGREEVKWKRETGGEINRR